MTRAVPDRCEYQGRRSRITGGFVECGNSLVFKRLSTGERVHLAMWSVRSHRFYGPCHWRQASKEMWSQAQAMWEDWPKGYVVYEETEAEALARESRERRFAHALRDGPVARVGGLMRMDGSGAQPLVRRIE